MLTLSHTDTLYFCVCNGSLGLQIKEHHSTGSVPEQCLIYPHRYMWIYLETTLHCDLHVPEFLEFVQGLAVRLLDSKAEENPLIKGLGNYHIEYPHYRLSLICKVRILDIQYYDNLRIHKETQKVYRKFVKTSINSINPLLFLFQKHSPVIKLVHNLLY